MSAIKKAHQIRKAAAVKFGCKLSLIDWAVCLRMAYRGEELETSTTTETVSWNTKDGREVIYTAEIILSEEINADGYKVTVNCCKIVESITIGGATEGGWWRNPTPPSKRAGAVKQYGSLAVLAESWSRIEAALGAIKSHPEWVANEARRAKNQEEIQEMESTRRRNGYCYKCDSYCYGDCEA